VLAGLGVGIASVAHGANLLIAPAIGLLILATMRRRGGKRTLVAGLAFAGGTMAAILPVTVRNYTVAGDVVLLTSNGGMNFFIGNNSNATGTHTVYEYPFALTSLRDYYLRPERGPDEPTPSQVSRNVGAEAWSWIKSDPVAALGLWTKKFALFWNNTELAINDHYHFFRQFSAVLRLPLVLFGMVAAVGLTGAVCLAGRLRDVRVLYIVLIAQVAAFVVMFVLGRYRFLAAACLMVMAGGQVAWWVAQIRTGSYRKLGGSLLLLAVFGIGTYWPIEGFDARRGQAKLYAALGGAYLQQARQAQDSELLDRAIDALTTAAELPWTESGLLASRSRLLFQLGNAWELRGESERAIDAWRQAEAEVEEELALPRGNYLPVRPPVDVLQRRLQMVQEKLRRAVGAAE
jgi:tetratricopeptide (TPR) repeat protein